MTEREQFEKWATETLIGRTWRSTEPGYQDEYADTHTQMAWRGWQGRAQQLAAAPVAPAEPTHPTGHADCHRCFGTGGVVLAGGKVATCICTTYAAPVAPANQTEK